MKLKISVDGKTYDVGVEVADEEAAQAFRRPVPRHVASRPRPAPQPLPEAEGALKVCKSPLTGIVLSIDVTVGQEIQPDDLLFVIEAMKMENHVTSADAGRVKAIRAAAGDAVKVGQILVEFE